MLTKLRRSIKSSGIYKITNIVNAKFYIGSSTDLYMRSQQHFSNLRYNKHSNTHLQASYNLYGENTFIFEVISFCPIEYLNKMEQWFVDNLKPHYNFRKIVESNRGITLSSEHKRKIGLACKGKKMSNEAKAKISLSKIGIPRTQELRDKLSALKKSKPNPIAKESIKKARIVAAKLKHIKVICLDTNIVYNSIIEASQLTGILDTSISKAAKGKQMTAGGRKWGLYPG
jgi:group I intron endonuclease